MKKLKVFLLATVFVFGMVGQVSAVEKVNEDAFIGEQVEVIDFDALGNWTPVPTEFSGGWFSAEVLYKDWYLSTMLRGYGAYGFGDTAINFNPSVGLGDLEAPAVKANFDPMVSLVGFNGLSPAFGNITVRVYREGVEIGSEVFYPAEGLEEQFIFVGVKDTAGIDAIEISSNGQCYGVVNALFIDNFQFGGTPDTGSAEKTPVYVTLNIKPSHCLYARIPINVESRGVTPAAIINDGTYDVTDIDVTTLRLQGVAPLDYAIEDASECGSTGGDGDSDLTLKFDTKSLADGIKNSLGEEDTLKDGDIVSLSLTGKLNDGTAIELKEEVNVIVSVKGKHEKHNNRRVHPFDPHSPHDRGLHKGWDKNR